MSSCLDRIDEVEPKLHAWVVYDRKNALSQAARIDKEIAAGAFTGKLWGVPVGIKDIYNTRDFPTEMGSPIWKGFTPGNDARSVHYLREQGAVVMGKTVTAEFAVHHPGPTVNPHNPKHTPGTSSSGSAAAVAAGMVPIATGSQTAGSTIRPASYCGVYGFKPTFGLIPRTGVLKTVDVLDHVTVFARTIEDTELAFGCMRVKGFDFPYIHALLEDPAKQNTDGPWRLAFMKTHLWDQWQPYAKEAITEYIQKLSDVPGLTVDECEIPEILTEAHDLHRIIYNKALSYYYKEEYDKHHEELSAVFRGLIEDGRTLTVDEYRAATHRQVELAHALDAFLEDYDGIITLSTAGEAKEGLDSVDTIDSCLIWTLCGAPTINLPVFSGPNGLPFGAQLVFRKYHDPSMFALLKVLKEHGAINDVPVE